MWRVLLSCASHQVHDDLFEPGEFSQAEAQAVVDRIMASSPGIEAYVVPSGANAREVLHEKGWI